MNKNRFQAELLSAAHIDYQVKVQYIGNFPSELSSILLTGAFPLSPSPNSTDVEGLKIFTFRQRYLCFCWFFQAGRQDERGRHTSSSRVLVFPLDIWQGLIPTLADVREWLKHHDVENMTDNQFYEAVCSLENTSLSSDLVKKAQQVTWFPYLLAKLIQQKHATIIASTHAEALSWLEILWYYTPDFLRLKIEWCTYIWSLRTDHEEVVAAAGQVELPPRPSLLKRLFKNSTREESEFRFDVVQGISSHQMKDLDLKPLEWLCQELVRQESWQGLEVDKKHIFIAESLERLSCNPRIKLSSLISGYPASPKLIEFSNLLSRKNPD